MARIVRHLHRQARFSRGLAADWADQNPIPFEGEPCYETDTEVLKIGDGATRYSDLPEFGGGGGVSDHGALTGLSDDDHTGYTTTAEAQALVDVHTGDTGDAHDASAISLLDTAAQYAATEVESALAEVMDALQTHEGAADPHTGYQRESEKDQASGYVGYDANGDIALVGDAITTDEAQLTLAQTGDVLGDSFLHLRNRTGANGAVFETTGPNLVDFGFDPPTGASGSIRYEGRASDDFILAPEFQIGLPADPGLVVATNKNVAARGSLAVTTAPITQNGKDVLDTDHTAAADPHTGYVLESLLDAKGDIIVATADNTPARLPVGVTNGHVLTVASGEATGLEWAAAAAPGSSVEVEEDNVSLGTATTLDFGTGLDVAFAAGEADITVDLSELTAFTDHSARHENGGADEISIAGLDGTSTALQAHLDDAADAHDASAISVLDSAAQITATDVEGALAEIVDAEQAHVAAADPHTGYRLESADHTHQSTGAQAGTLDHGLALTGLTDDDHTQYLKETDVAAKGDIYAASANDTVGVLSVGTNGQRLTPKSGDALGVAWQDDEFTVGGVLLDPSGARTIEVWRAPFACEVTAYHARVVGGTNAVTNAQVDATDILTGDLTTTPADGWEAGTIKSDGTEDITAGEVIKLEVVSISGTPTEITWELTLRRAA